MPTYEYKCEPCRVIYRVRHGMNDSPAITCPECSGETARMLSAPMLNTGGHSSPTAAKFARMSDREEIARETELQKTYRTIWLPPPVVHNPWEGDH